jgi:arylsulfatase A-like enzyme
MHVSPQERTALITGYDECLAFLDNSMDELLDSLSRLPGWGNTVVIITSDHGEGFGEHGTYSHGLSLYREVLHVPLVIFGAQIPGELRVAQLVPTQDLFSTVLEFTGADAAVFQRTSLRRYWTPGFHPGEFDDAVVSELLPKFPSAGLSPSISLTTCDWQYIRNSRGDEELYHWPSDPDERLNLAGGSEYGKIREDLRARLLTLASESLRPWQRPQYLSALDEPGRPYLNFTASFIGREPAPAYRHQRIGDAQAALPPRASAASQHQPAADEELLRSIPYY